MASTTTSGLPGPHGFGPEGTRRDFLGLVTGAATALGTAAIAWTLMNSMNPAADVIAAGAPMDIDISKIEPGQQIVVRWRGDPILLVQPHARNAEDVTGSEVRLAACRPQLARRSAAGIRDQLAPLGQAGTRRAGRHLHPSWLPAKLLAEAQPERAGAELARRLSLPLPRLEIRSWPDGSIPTCPRRTICRCHPMSSRMRRRCEVGSNPPGSTFELGEVVQL